ncbi:LLM class flavin-dependent oxidoreductase [Rhizorhabdus argentea]|uniref:LLM class flavin-dependent oxidoreductase n=1 Tax=Rhizorhabdus argentea TaxID=1387174 RepID=UPI0030EBB168
MMLEIWLRYDLRSPAFATASVDLASAAIEQVAWADKKGFHTIQLPEHHCSDDNYNPSPLILGAAMASRTSTMRIHPCAIILPLHDPVRIAEDCVVVDIVSNGRLDVTIGLGYVPAEFEMFGVPLSERGRLTDSKLEVLQRAFAGETFEYEGRKIRVTPSPVQEGGPPLFIGGSVKATAKRAARYGHGYFPMIYTEEAAADYRDACVELGKTPGRVINARGPRLVHVSEDPDAAWAKIAPHAMYETNAYAAYAEKLGQVTQFERAETPEQLRASGTYLVVTPDECLAIAREQRDLGRILIIPPLVGGLDPEVSWESIELIGTKVIPELIKDDAA